MKHTIKRSLCRLLALWTLLLALCSGVFAAAEDDAQALCTLDVFRGTGGSFELARAPKRSEAAAMLVRLYGAETQAQALYAEGQLTQPFSDGEGWCAPYLAWLWENGLARGVSETRFGAEQPCSARDYAVFLLRALGYRDGEDFTYQDAEAFAERCGFYSRLLFCGTFTRAELARMTLLALRCPTKGTTTTLLQALTDSGAIEKDAAAPLLAAQKTPQAKLEDGQIAVRESLWRQKKDELALCVSFESEQALLPGGEESLLPAQLEELAQPAEGGYVRLNPQALDEQIERWEQTYCTYDAPYYFDSYLKGPTPVSFLRCNYGIDREALQKALLWMLFDLESGTVSAPVSCTDTSGRPFGLGDTYVEVDLDNQRLTYFKNGALVISTPIVTGNLAAGHNTPTGLYYSHNRLRNCTLVGSDFRVFVKYWVSVIYDVIGLHDASWRSAFGGEYYVNEGSHGCVNIPEAAMATIFNEIDDGTPVLIYGRNEWYQIGSEDSPVTGNPLH